MILATKHDALPEFADAQRLVDIDLSILGAPPPRFDQYEGQVRLEYAWVNDVAFKAGRSKILKQFLDRPSIYGMDLFRDQLEQRARDNLARSIAALNK